MHEVKLYIVNAVDLLEKWTIDILMAKHASNPLTLM
jgi:hypothetical protein